MNADRIDDTHVDNDAIPSESSLWTSSKVTSEFVNAAGDNMSGALNMNSNSLSNLGSSGVGFSGTGLDMNAKPIFNIGNAGTDFGTNGSLTLANALTVTTGGATISNGGAVIKSSLPSTPALTLQAVSPSANNGKLLEVNYIILVKLLLVYLSLRLQVMV